MSLIAGSITFGLFWIGPFYPSFFFQEDIVKTQSTLKNFFSEVRSRGHAVYDDWIELEKSAIDIWRMALEEKNLHTYYEVKYRGLLILNERVSS